jgi:hypothetical protein
MEKKRILLIPTAALTLTFAAEATARQYRSKPTTQVPRRSHTSSRRNFAGISTYAEAGTFG